MLEHFFANVIDAAQKKCILEPPLLKGTGVPSMASKNKSKVMP